MRAKSVLIFFILLMTSCAVNDQIVENQISVNSNQTAPVNQNTNTSYISNEPVKKEVDYFAHIKPEHRKVLRDWLKFKPYLRPGVEEIDNSMYEEKYKQYFEGNMRFLRETVGQDGYQYYSVMICPISGMRATAKCPTKEAKVFKKGEEPQEFCNFHN